MRQLAILTRVGLILYTHIVSEMQSNVFTGPTLWNYYWPAII